MKHEAVRRSGKVFSFLLAAVIALYVLCTGQTVYGSGINATDVTLYCLDPSYSSYISIPDGKPTEFRLSVSGASITSCRVVEGSSCVVSSSGLISPRYTETYYVNTGETVQRPSYGDSVVECTAGGVTYRVNVTVQNYAVTYADEQVRAYVDSHITSGMSDQEKMNAIAAYPASFDYGAGSSSYVSMIILGNGDCWASTSLIIKECEMLGITAWVRNANRDPGAGSGHRNAMARLNGNYYELEAGFSGTAPRGYYAYKRNTLFSYLINEEGLHIYQYDGYPAELSVLTIPSQIEGHDLVAIDQSFIHSDNLTSVVLPSTLRSIGNYAFSGCRNLTTVNIPASVTHIGQGVFAQDTSLTSLTVDPSNTSYRSVDNNIYTRDMTHLVAAPSCSSITIPSTCTSIDNYAFYYNDVITSVTVPSSVTSLGEGAFADASGITSLTFEGTGLRTIDNYAFADMTSLSELTLPASVESLSTYAFYNAPAIIHLQSMTAPSIPDDFVRDYTNRIIYVPAGATGYDTGKWAELDVRPESEYVPPESSGNGGSSSGSGGSSSGGGTSTGGSGDTGPVSTPAIPTPSTNVPSTSETGVSGFVERLYTVALGRNSDPSGKQNWIDAITLRGETGASAARGFLYSPEFLNKDVTPEEFVAVLYRTFFDREPDQAGFNAWVNALNGGASKEEVIEGFINSTEWANLCLRYGIAGGGTGVPNISVEPNQGTVDFCTRLYTTCLGRSADNNGLMAWARQLANQRDTGTGAARGFFFSSEFTGQNVSNGEYVTRLYRTFMGREPDQSGYSAWVSQLDSGISREEVFDGFAQSPEFTRICASYGIIR